MTRVELCSAVRARAMRAFPIGHPHQPLARQRLQAMDATAWDDPKIYTPGDLESAWAIVCRRTP